MHDSAPIPERIRALESELAALHREWHREQERYLVPGENGELQEPKHGGNIGVSIGLMVGSVILMAFAAASPLPPIAAYVGLIPFAVGTFRLLSRSMTSERYERAATAYHSRRTQLLTQIARLQAGQADENSG